MNSELIYEVSNSALIKGSTLAGQLDPGTSVIAMDALCAALRMPGGARPRNIREVIQQIIPLIPADLPEEQSDDDFTELKGELDKFTGSWFAAPEVEMPLWIGLATTLEEWFGEPKSDWPDWKWEVLAIFSGTKGGAIETPSSIPNTPTAQD